jgi:hypothetical protein
MAGVTSAGGFCLHDSDPPYGRPPGLSDAGALIDILHEQDRQTHRGGFEVTRLKATRKASSLSQLYDKGVRKMQKFDIE